MESWYNSLKQLTLLNAKQKNKKKGLTKLFLYFHGRLDERGSTSLVHIIIVFVAR